MRLYVSMLMVGVMMSESVVAGTLIEVQSAQGNICLELDDSEASQTLCSMLPLHVQIGNYSDNEKVFQPSKKLKIGPKTRLAKGGSAGIVGYFAPWNNVVLYYGDFGPYSELYELGRVVSGMQIIEKLSGQIELKKKR